MLVAEKPLEMGPIIHSRKTVYVGVVVLLITLGLPSSISKPGSSNVSVEHTGETNVHCGSTICSKTIPDTHSKLDDVIYLSSGNSSSNHPLQNQTRADAKLDIVKSAEFSVFQDLIQGVIDKFSRTTTASESSNITESVNIVTTTEESNSPKVPPGILKNLKYLVPPFLSELFGQLSETFEKHLPEIENATTTESIGILESFRQTVLGMAPDKPRIQSTSETNQSSPELKKELNDIMNELKRHVENPAVKKSRIDKLCEIFEEHVKSNIQKFNQTSSSPTNNKIVSALEGTTKLVCSNGNKKLMKELANSQSIWSNRITKRVLGRAIDKISKGKTMLRFVLNMIMSTIVEPPQPYYKF
ncbi:hypothetical protein GE061_015511 [Apolygus lucorum]|uniref:Uncharacterized protein n=1 Tax=Apolygus lucorum TaxID=248454 RepID=A0A8S9XN98_APOLU|nr:hypothetical protein GE061_015511 [Apolygus lucorum]